MAVKTNVNKNGKDYFRITVSVGRDENGKYIRKEFYGKSEKDAIKKRDEYLEGIKNGLAHDYKENTLKDLFDSWLFDVKKSTLKPATFEKYEGIHRNYVKNADFYNMKLNIIKPIHIQRYYNALAKEGKTCDTIDHLNRLLRAFFRYAIEHDYILKNPCSGSKVIIPGLKDKVVEEIEVFSDEDVQKIKTVIESRRIKQLFFIALGTGMRQGELLALKWSNVDLEKCEIKIKESIRRCKIFNDDGTSERKTIEQTTKTASSFRTIPIPSKLIKYFRELKIRQATEKLAAGKNYIDGDFVFSTELGKPLLAKSVYNSNKSLLKAAGVDYKKFHTTRHTYATRLFEAGVAPKTVQALLGHKDLKTTAAIYTHVTEKIKETAVESLNSILL